MFHDTTLIIIGFASGILNVVAFIPYIRDILRHKTKPQRATWWIWLSLNAVLLAVQWAAGATWSLGLIVGQSIVAGIIAILSLRFGYGKLEKHDVVSLAIAAVGVGLWVYTKNPLTALVILVAVDALGSALTAAKAWHSPESETLITWAISVVANLLGLLAVSTWSLGTVIYPMYSFIANAIITAIIVWRLRVLKARARALGT